MSTEIREQLTECYRRMGEARLGSGASGNVSCRSGDRVFITPTGARPDTLTPEQVVEMSLEGVPAAGQLRPSSEWRMHTGIYSARPQASAIVHCHSRFATTLACAHRALPAVHYMIAAAGSREIPLAPYATFGTTELAELAVATMGEGSAVLLANHGQIALGDSLESALALAIEVEELAALYVGAEQLGGARILDDSAMSLVEEAFATYGQQS
jgi:L-fuculose-phosphate aldolase